jgi:hypothetical protein
MKSLIITRQSCLLLVFSMKDEDCDLPLLYFVPKLHNCPYKQGYITGPAKGSKVLASNFVDRCLSFCTLSFGHCVVFSSSKYEF